MLFVICISGPFCHAVSGLVEQILPGWHDSFGVDQVAATAVAVGSAGLDHDAASRQPGIHCQPMSVPEYEHVIGRESAPLAPAELVWGEPRAVGTMPPKGRPEIARFPKEACLESTPCVGLIQNHCRSQVDSVRPKTPLLGRSKVKYNRKERRGSGSPDRSTCSGGSVSQGR